MSTKSWRMPSILSSSRMRVPVPPPARPVAMTGTSSRLRARAMLMPLPPGSAKPSLARCRCPSWKLGTVRIRSRAALRVTVMIMSGAAPWTYLREPTRNVSSHALRVPRGLVCEPRLRDRRPRDERRTGQEPAAGVDLHLAQGLSPSYRQRNDARRHDSLDEHRAEPHRTLDRPACHELDRPAVPLCRGARVHAVRRDDRREPVAREPEPEQGRKVLVALRARGPAEECRVDRHAAGPRCCDLPVGSHEVRLSKAELLGARVHQGDEALLVAAHVVGKCLGGVVRALDQ